MAEPTDSEPAPTPEPTPWQRKHRPEPNEASDGTSVNGRVLMAMLGAIGSIASIGLSIAGFVNALDRHQEEAAAPPAVQNAQAVNPFKQVLSKSSPPAEVLDSVETKLVDVGKEMARIEANSNRNTIKLKNPDTAKLFAELRRVLGELRTQLASLDSSKLKPEELTKRDRFAERAEELSGKLTTLISTE